MMLAYTYHYMQKELNVPENKVTYELVEEKEFYIAGYLHKHTPLSGTDEAFIQSTLREKKEALRSLVDGEVSFIGATFDFVNGAKLRPALWRAVRRAPSRHT